MRRIAIPRDLRDFAAVFRAAGHACYFVGGAVRDSLAGRRAADWDAATDAEPGRVMSLFRSVIPTGVKHGTVTVRWRGSSIEVTTFRVDGEYRDGRRPESVRFTTDLLEDLSRRDFTINGMAADPGTGEVVDPFGGLGDLEAGLVRAIGDPAARFDEDGLRPLRAVRFATRFGFDIEPATFAAIGGALERFRSVSAERVRDELSRILACERPSTGLVLLERSGLLPCIVPELSACRGVGQGGPHRFDVLDHSLAACDAATDDPVLRLAALLHDVGKPACRREDADGDLSFIGHDQESARLASEALKRLKYPSAVVDSVAHLVRHHMFDYRPEWTDAAVRRFAAKVGLENVRPLALLRLADSSGTRGFPSDPATVLPLVERVEELAAKDQAFGLRDLAVGGDELSAAGWPRGPAMGRVLQELLEAVLDDPALNERERLLFIAGRLKSKYGVE